MPPPPSLPSSPPLIHVIGVPLDLGAGRHGVDMGPSAIRYAGINDQLLRQGHRVRDLGNLPIPLVEQLPAPPAGEQLRYFAPIMALCSTLADCVEAALRDGAFPLVLGGDHSLAAGSVAGAARGRRIGLLWVDAHGDYNTAETSPSGNMHGMSLAALTGRGHPDLVQLAGAARAVYPGDVAIVGVRDLDVAEREALRASGVLIYTMHEVDRRGMAAVIEEALERISRNTEGYYVSFDLDVLDPRETPGVGTPVMAGISAREALLAMELVAEHGGMIGMDLVEVNPILDERNVTAELAVALALSACGKRIL